MLHYSIEGFPLSDLTPTHLTYAALLAGSIAAISGLLRLLTFSGALAAFVVGFFVFGFGGLPFAVPLLAFFFSSSLLSRVGRGRKARYHTIYDKTARRDAGQVLANGAVAAALAFAFAFTPSTRQTALLYLAALAAVNADTWATEIGGLAPGRPFLITTLRRVDPGTSGGVSLLGLIAALLGALFVAGAGWLAWPLNTTQLLWKPDAPEILSIAWAGFIAAFADSILGASLQAQYRCSRCGRQTERSAHCDQPARRLQGWRWITNDVVNFLASLLGVLFAWLLLTQFTYPI